MAATKWRLKRVVVEIAVYDDCIAEKDLRWAVERALESSQTFDHAIRRNSKPMRLGRVMIKSLSKMLASGALRDVDRGPDDKTLEGRVEAIMKKLTVGKVSA
jgi:hypothetical protein